MSYVNPLFQTFLLPQLQEIESDYVTPRCRSKDPDTHRMADGRLTWRSVASCPATAHRFMRLRQFVGAGREETGTP